MALAKAGAYYRPYALTSRLQNNDAMLGGEDLSRCAHVLCWKSVGALSLSVRARARAGVAGERFRRASGSDRTTPAGGSGPAWRQHSERTCAAVYPRARRSGGDTGPFHENLVNCAAESSVTYR